MEDYSKRSLTVADDKLPALSGMASKHALARGWGSEDYLAGLWRKTLLTDLLWRTVPLVGQHPRRTDVWRVPSWSSASIDGAIDYDIVTVTSRKILEMRRF